MKPAPPVTSKCSMARYLTQLTREPRQMHERAHNRAGEERRQRQQRQPPQRAAGLAALTPIGAPSDLAARLVAGGEPSHGAQ